MSRLAAVVMTLTSAAALAWPEACLAQMYRPEALQGFEALPPAHMMMTRDAVRALDAELEEMRAPGVLRGGKLRIDRYPRPEESGETLTLYGRFYLVNFRNEVDESDARTKFTWRRTGPRISNARIYIGFQVRF